MLLRGTDECGPYCCNRLFDWTMGVAMCAVGTGLFFWPSALAFGNLHKMLALVGEVTLAVTLLYVGVVRIVFLVANGMMPWSGPIIRAGCSTFGAVVLSQMAYALASNGVTPMPPGTFLFAVFAAAEIVSAYRAGSDARERGRRNP